MPELELGPNEYRKQVRGRWQLPNDPKLARNMLVVMAAVLVYIFANRDGVSSASLFGVTALFSFVAGGMLALWLRD